MWIQKVTPRTARRVALQCVTLTKPNLNQAAFSGGWPGEPFHKTFWHKHKRSDFRDEGITPGYGSQIRRLAAARKTQV